MKTAWEYRRKSEEDQSNWSISGQGLLIHQFSDRQNIRIQKTFTDDGRSGGDFNRPEWKQLEREIKAARQKPDFLIIGKYDRLIRNLKEGLIFIDQLEKELGVILLSAMENFQMNVHSPYFFKMRAQLLLDAEFERRVISDRTKFGIWSANTQGRYVHMAPFGYINNNPDKGNKRPGGIKPFLTVDPVKAPIIQAIFKDFLEGLPYVEIIRRARKKGFTVQGNDVLRKVITNHTYAGLVRAKGYHSENAKTVRATHDPIIDEDTFWRAYYKLKDSIRPQYHSEDKNIPLRGYLQCQCHKSFTGGPSKGRHGGVYYYYRCLSCRGQNYSAKIVHQEIDMILSAFSWPAEMILDIQTEFDYQLQEKAIERGEDVDRVKSDMQHAKKALSKLEEKFINDKIDEEVYHKWRPIYIKDIDDKQELIRKLSTTEGDRKKLFADTLPKFNDLVGLYNWMNILGKHDVLKFFFPGGLIRKKEGYRTPIIEPMGEVNLLKLNGLLVVENPEEAPDSLILPSSTLPGGLIEPRSLEYSLRKFNQILIKHKAA